MSRHREVTALYSKAIGDGLSPKKARAAVAKELGVEVDTVRRYVSYTTAVIEEAPAAVMPPQELWDLHKNLARKTLDQRATQGKATIRVDSNKPIGIVPITDQHAGSHETDYERMEYDADIVAKTDRMFALLGGDTVDNFISAKMLLPMLEAEVSPESQWALAGHYLDMFDGKILALVSGNHEHRTRLAAGVDIVRSLAQQRRILYDPHEFFITLKVGGQEYRILIRHKPGRFNSSFNRTHANKRLLQLGDYKDPPHVTIIAHHHAPAVEYAPWQSENRVHIRTGSYQVQGDYERDHAFSGGGYMVPTVILWPDRFEMMAVPTLEAAADFLNSFNDA